MMVIRIKQMTVTFKVTVILVIFLSACAPQAPTSSIQNMITPMAPTAIPAPTSGRPHYSPGQLVDYTAQDGDTLIALAARFNTTIEQILQANPVIPKDATTMPPGFPMKIPIYYVPLWGTAFQSIPDQAFVDGPAQIGFSTTAFVASTNGWLKNYRAYAGDANRSGAELVDY